MAKTQLNLVLYQYSNKDKNKVREFTALSGLLCIQEVIVEYSFLENEQTCDVRSLAKVPVQQNSTLRSNKNMKRSAVDRGSNRKQLFGF